MRTITRSIRSGGCSEGVSVRSAGSASLPDLPREPLLEQGEDGTIHGRENAPLMYDKPQQVCIGDLLVPRQPPGKRLSGLDETDFVSPETMRRVIQVGAEKFHCFQGSYGVA